MTQCGRMWSLALALLLGGCSASNVRLAADEHLQAPQATPRTTPGEIPSPVKQSFILPPPKAQAKAETYSVVVNKVPVHELLFALARDAKMNVDIHPGIEGTVTLNALDQTLPQLLTRVASQVDMRFEINGNNLAVMPDTPFLRTYRVDYLSLNRDSSSSMAISSAVGSWTTTASSTSSNTNYSQNGTANSLGSTAKNHFYETLVQNLKDLLRETDKQIPSYYCITDNQGQPQGQAQDFGAAATLAPATAQSGIQAIGQERAVATTAQTQRKCMELKEAATTISNPETGVITVRATSRQHEKVQEFLDSVLNRVKRQVLIDVTVAEVKLSHNYQQGIDWTALNIFDTGLKFIQTAAGSITGATSSMAQASYNSSGGNFTSTVKLLDAFGTVKILSSPKLSVLNNQTAVMKVVDDSLYFTYEIKETDATTTTAAKTTITSTLHSVPVGLVLSITPQVGDDDIVTLYIRPSISRVIGQKTDPSLSLMSTTASTLTNTIPIIRSREFDSVMRVSNGNIAVMGGLMEDILENTDNMVPGLSKTPILGGLFQNRDDTKTKTELVIFVRPTIVRDPSLEGDYSTFSKNLPNDRFFDHTAGPALTPGVAK